MALRLVTTKHHKTKQLTAIIYIDTDIGEYQVVFTKNGSELRNSKYYADSKQDAIDTADLFLSTAAASPRSVLSDIAGEF